MLTGILEIANDENAVLIVDDEGNINDAALASGKMLNRETILSDWFKTVAKGYNFSSMDGQSTLYAGFYHQPVLRQYVTDMQRLAKFNTGAEADWEQITFGKTGETAFSVAAAK